MDLGEPATHGSAVRAHALAAVVPASPAVARRPESPPPLLARDHAHVPGGRARPCDNAPVQLGRALAAAVGAAVAATGVWIALAAPEPGRVPPVEPLAPPPPAAAPAPAAEPAPAPEPEPPDPGAESFEPPTEEQIAKLTSSDYWGWVLFCRENGSRRALRTLVDLTIRFRDEKYHEQVWVAIVTRLNDAETEVAQGPTEETRRRYESALADLDFLAEAIHRALGESRFKEQIAEWRRLELSSRRTADWVAVLFDQAQRAVTKAGASAALQRLEAILPLLRRVGTPEQRARCVALMAICKLRSGDRDGATKLYEQAEAEFAGVGTDELLRELRRLTDALDNCMR